jgi:hypothetical protein
MHDVPQGPDDRVSKQVRPHGVHIRCAPKGGCMNRYSFLPAVLLIIVFSAHGQKTQVSHFNSNGAIASGNIFSESSGTFISGWLEVAAGCYAGRPESNTHLFYFINVYSATGTYSSWGEGCVPNTAFVPNPSKKTAAFAIDVSTLDPNLFFQSSSGPPTSTVVSATWEQTNTTEYLSSGTQRSTYRFPGFIIRTQQQGTSQGNSANFSASILGLSWSGTDAGFMTFVRNVSVDISRTTTE